MQELDPRDPGVPLGECPPELIEDLRQQLLLTERSAERPFLNDRIEAGLEWLRQNFPAVAAAIIRWWLAQRGGNPPMPPAPTTK